MSVREFFQSLPYEPDPFQIAAAEAVEEGESVVVTAPTGAGKTLIAEAAIALVLERGRRVYYTTPLKALSNQKFGDFRRLYGEDRVGLLTGDNSVNGSAPVVVMTTEVLRNMIYTRSSDLHDVAVVVLDEVHYLQDRFRGAVWEEVIIHAPRHIQLVALSATIANPSEFTDWVTQRRGPTRLVLEDHRPVPLESLYAWKALGGGDGLTILPMFAEANSGQQPNREIIRRLNRGQTKRPRIATPRRHEVVEELARTDRLPAIYFVFSRAGCDEAASSMVNAHVSLTSADERVEIRERAEALTRHLDDQDLAVLEYGHWLHHLEAGVAAHHAGMVPAFKETVEELFADGLVKLVFATETLALGINMPARTVVLDKISKYTGDGHDLLLPGEYTQLTGRAGRRGIDDHGYGVVLHSRFVRFDRVASIASTGSHALVSSFRPTYNMVVNLIANYPKERAEELLKASFAQFLQDRGLAKRQAAIRRNQRRLETSKETAEDGVGDIWSYLDNQSGQVAKGAKAARSRAAEKLKVGEVIEIPGGRLAGRFLLGSKRSRNAGAIFETVSSAGERKRLRARDLPLDTEVLGKMDVPRPFPPANPADVRRLGERVAEMDPTSARSLVPVVEIPSAHAAAADPNIARRAAAARRVRRIDRELARQRKQQTADAAGLVGQMTKVLTLLEEWGYVDGWDLTELGDTLRVVYSETDLMVVEAGRRGVFDGLDLRELSALISCFVFDPRAEESTERLPTPALEDRWDRVLEIAEELGKSEERIGLPPTRAPEPGFGALAYHWAGGIDLDELLDGDDMAAGDFVRTMRQILDLLRQVRDSVPGLEVAADQALVSINRGVVAAGGIG